MAMAQEISEWMIRLEGRVQGVGVRATVFRLASLYQINGFVRNCSDGSVEICAQGLPVQLEAFLESVRIRPGRGSIAQIKIERRRPQEIFSAFTVR
jgi:acylphosphatase